MHLPYSLVLHHQIINPHLFKTPLMVLIQFKWEDLLQLFSQKPLTLYNDWMVIHVLRKVETGY